MHLKVVSWLDEMDACEFRIRPQGAHSKGEDEEKASSPLFLPTTQARHLDAARMLRAETGPIKIGRAHV